MNGPAFEFPPDLADADTVGMIYDETDGLNFYNEYGMLRELFADPALAADKRYADVLMGYLRAETIGPLPFRRLAAAYRTQPTRCSGRPCGSRSSPGPTMASPSCAGGRPGTTSVNPVLVSPWSATASTNSSADRPEHALVAPAQSRTIDLTITPSRDGTAGTVVHGTLYVDVFAAFNELGAGGLTGSDVIAIPYEYTIG